MKLNDFVYEAFRKIHDWGLCEAEDSNDCKMYRTLAQFLGYVEETDIYRDDKRADQNIAKLQTLLGPHGLTIFKAWKAKHGR